MDARDLLKTWPEWSRAGAERVLASPAWKMSVRFAGEPATLTFASEPPACALALNVHLNDEPKVLTLALSPRFPDLWSLREHLAGLPREVLLALAEKECGAVFQFMEDFFHASFSIDGVADAAGTGAVFSLVGEGEPVLFALELSRETSLQLGRLDNLDPTHESIRALTREGIAKFASLPLTAEETAALAPGDFLLLDERASGPSWTLELPVDGDVQVVSPNKATLTFAQLADDELPPIPDCAEFDLVRAGRPFATAIPSAVGSAQALRVQKMLS